MEVDTDLDYSDGRLGGLVRFTPYVEPSLWYLVWPYFEPNFNIRIVTTGDATDYPINVTWSTLLLSFGDWFVVDGAEVEPFSARWHNGALEITGGPAGDLEIDPDNYLVFGYLSQPNCWYPEWGYLISGMDPDPWTGTYRTGNWTLTTFYTPKEESDWTERTFTYTCTVPGDPDTHPVIHISEEFETEILLEGWGLLDSDRAEHSELAGLYVSGVGDHDIRSRPKGSGGTPDLEDYVSLATDPTVIRKFVRAAFEMPAGNGWSGGSVNGISHDVGSGIVGQDIDFYVGDRSLRNSGASDAYNNNHSSSGPVAVGL